MPARLEARPFTGSLALHLRDPAGAGLSLYWLGQAGFLLRSPGCTLLIDPYLSDSLAEKYRGTPLPHRRMMPPPIELEELGPLDLVLCTHHHTDHMDPATLAPLFARNGRLRMVAPRAKLSDAMARAAVTADRIIALDAGAVAAPLPGLEIRATRAAHETLERDAQGNFVFLGYGISLAGLRVFHSGDSIPFPGQIEEVRTLQADLALLPVNGRSAALAAQRVPGNFHLAEAMALATAAGIPAMIAHHFDMFAFNTLPREEIESAASQSAALRLLPGALNTEYRLQAPAAPSCGGSSPEWPSSPP